MTSSQASPTADLVTPSENLPKQSIDINESQRAYTTRSHKRHKSLDLSTITHPEPEIIRSESSDTKVDEHISQPPIIKSNENINQTESLDDLLGIQVNSWPYSEKILASTISLKTEMERTRREEYKLTSINQSIELLKLAIQANVPPHLIPFVFNSNNLKDEDKDELKQITKTPGKHSTSTSVFKVNMPQQQQFQFHHWQKPDGSIQRSDISSTGSTIGSSSNQIPSTPNRANDERKRKFSTDEETEKPITPHQVKPIIPNHRRNQSEASVSQLRSIYENQISQSQQPSHQRNPSYSLRSPYVYPPQEKQMMQQQQQHPPPPPYRSNFYQYPPQQPRPMVTPGTPGTPLRGAPSIHLPQHPQRIPQHFIPGPPQTFQFPQKPPHPPPLQPLQTRGFTSVESSPVSTKPKGKGDVSFLISTPNNPPK